MITNAGILQKEFRAQNEVDGPMFKTKDDPRLTRVGELLRKLSLDELLQVINVLKTDMRLVGPRPFPLREYNGFDQDWQRRRFSVRPGITCFWQVDGRSHIPFENRMELDMQYIDKWSPWLDFKFFARLLPRYCKGSGAADYLLGDRGMEPFRGTQHPFGDKCNSRDSRLLWIDTPRGNGRRLRSPLELKIDDELA